MTVVNFFPNRPCIADVGILCSSKQQTDFTEICRFDLLNFKSKLWKVKDTINHDFFSFLFGPKTQCNNRVLLHKTITHTIHKYINSKVHLQSILGSISRKVCKSAECTTYPKNGL